MPEQLFEPTLWVLALSGGLAFLAALLNFLSSPFFWLKGKEKQKKADLMRPHESDNSHVRWETISHEAKTYKKKAAKATRDGLYLLGASVIVFLLGFALNLWNQMPK